MPATRAWFLNLDADDELALGRGHTASAAARARSAELAARLGPLVPEGDLVIGPPPLSAARRPGLWGRAFCPTPRALAALAAWGARPAPAPPFEVLRRVNHRAFCAELGQGLEGARFARSMLEVDEVIASGASSSWLCKRPFGYAGRGRRAIGAALEPSDRAWIEATLRAGEGLQVEPFVAIVAEHGLHGYLAPSGMLTLGEPTVQGCDARGAWIATERAPEGALGRDEQDALERAAREAAEALARAGYFGPFGVDAYRYRCAAGALRYNARSEINARYSMGWAVGMGAARPDLEDPASP